MGWKDKFCDVLLKDNIIDSDEVDIIKYGIHQGFMLVLNILTLLFFCYLFGTLYQGIIFLLFFFPLRIYAGGYHANTESRCYLLSTIAEVIIFGVCCKIPVGSNWYFPITIMIASITIGIFAPQDNNNKKLNRNEYKVYKKKVIFLLIIQDIIFGVIFCMGWKETSQIIVSLQMLMVVLLVSGKVKDKMFSKKSIAD